MGSSIPDEVHIRYEYQYGWKEMPDLRFTDEVFDSLLDQGFFPTYDFMDSRSHINYNGGLKRVWHIRYRVQDFELGSITRQAVRVWKKNAGFRTEIQSPFSLSHEDTKLYERYAQRTEFCTTTDIASIIPIDKTSQSIPLFNALGIRVYDCSRLIASGVFYAGRDSAASVLHFFDYDYAGFSPGKFLILKTLNYLKSNGYEWYYPGYVVAKEEKFRYKLFFTKNYEAFFLPIKFFLYREFKYLRPMWMPFEDWMLEVPPLRSS